MSSESLSASDQSPHFTFQREEEAKGSSMLIPKVNLRYQEEEEEEEDTMEIKKEKHSQVDV